MTWKATEKAWALLELWRVIATDSTSLVSWMVNEKVRPSLGPSKVIEKV